jgi:acetyl esterase/lipase
MRSEQLENIIALLRSSDSNGPSTVDDWRVAYDNLGRLVPANPDIAVEPADGVRGEWIGDGDGSIVVYLHGGGYCIGSLTSHRAMLTHRPSTPTQRSIRWCAPMTSTVGRTRTPAPTDPRRPAVSPLFGDFTGLPPLHIEVGTAEVLLDDSRRNLPALHEHRKTAR